MGDNLKKRIMRRVYAIWTFRRLTSPFMVKLYIVAVSIWQLSKLVWVREVFSNTLVKPDWLGRLDYLIGAFASTELAVQAFAAAAALAGLFLFKDLLTANFAGNLKPFGLRR